MISDNIKRAIKKFVVHVAPAILIWAKDGFLFDKISISLMAYGLIVGVFDFIAEW